MGLGATEVVHNVGGGALYTLNHKGKPVGRINLVVSGEHNAFNFPAACAASVDMGVSLEDIKGTGYFQRKVSAGCKRLVLLVIS